MEIEVKKKTRNESYRKRAKQYSGPWGKYQIYFNWDMDNEFIKQISMNRFKKVSKIQSRKNTNKVILDTV